MTKPYKTMAHENTPEYRTAYLALLEKLDDALREAVASGGAHRQVWRGTIAHFIGADLVKQGDDSNEALEEIVGLLLGGIESWREYVASQPPNRPISSGCPANCGEE